VDARAQEPIGDVRSRSTKRVAAAVGEGAQVVAALHAYLAAPELAADPLGESDGRRCVPSPIVPRRRRAPE
jgi:hypothetical protein